MNFNVVSGNYVEAMRIVYMSMFMFRLDAYAAEPWYLDILLYPVTLY